MKDFVEGRNELFVDKICPNSRFRPLERLTERREESDLFLPVFSLPSFVNEFIDDAALDNYVAEENEKIEEEEEKEQEEITTSLR